MLLGEARELTQDEYNLFRNLIYDKAGINLGDHKMQLVRARLGKRMRAGDFSSYRDYYEFVRKDASGRELAHLIDAISTNTTHLFREPQHFEFLAKRLSEWAQQSGKHTIRIWSAGCSSGEEPYTLAMTAYHALRDKPGMSVKILATDISTRMLDRAAQGCFTEEKLRTVPDEYRRNYFTREGRGGDAVFRVSPEVRKLITFGRFNLMNQRFVFNNGFEVIFCRNVMIYFDRDTQTALVNRYATVLNAGGYLMIGHSESLNNIEHPLTYVAPTIYQRKH